MAKARTSWGEDSASLSACGTISTALMGIEYLRVEQAAQNLFRHTERKVLHKSFHELSPAQAKAPHVSSSSSSDGRLARAATAPMISTEGASLNDVCERCSIVVKCRCCSGHEAEATIKHGVSGPNPAWQSCSVSSW